MDWEDFKLDLSSFKDIRVNRYMFDKIPEKVGKAIKIQLFIFSDSSRRMICATAYIRLTFEYYGNIRRFATLATANIRTKSETISLPTA